jgi:hypothetical protein
VANDDPPAADHLNASPLKPEEPGKSDPLDAVEAARAALSGRAQGHSKSHDGSVEAIRVLVVAKRSARQARVTALTQVRHLGISAPVPHVEQGDPSRGLLRPRP